MASGGKIEFNEALVRGLRPDVRIGINAPFLESCNDCKTTEFGVVEQDINVDMSESDPISGEAIALTEAASATKQFAFPFPQIFAHESIDPSAGVTGLLCYDIDIFKYDIDSGDSQGILTLAEVLTPSNSETIISGTAWQEARFNRVVFLTNGNTFISYLPHSSQDSWQYLTGSTNIANNTVVDALARVGNRLVMGGITLGADFLAGTNASVAPNDWSTLLTAWQERDAANSVTYDNFALDKSCIIWSMDAGGEYYFPFVSLMGMIGHMEVTEYAKINEAVISMIDAGRLGMMPLPCKDIKVIKPMGELAIVYGLAGIVAVSLNDYTKKVISTSTGVAGRGCVVETEDAHYFIDVSNDIWRLSSDLKLEKLGYKEYGLSKTNTVASYDPTEKDIYFSDDTVGSLVLSRSGASINYIAPTSTSTAHLRLVYTFNKVIGTESAATPFFNVDSDWAKGDGTVTITGNVLRFIASSSTATQASGSQASAVLEDRKYRVSILIRSISGGGIKVSLGTGNGTTRSATGYFFQTITAGGATPSIVITASGGVTADIGEISVVAVPKPELVTQFAGFESRLPETIVGIAIAGTDHDGADVKISYRYDKDAAFTDTSYTTFDDRGIARVKVTCFEFKLSVRFPDDTDIGIDKLSVMLASGQKLGLKEMLAA